MIQCNVLGPVAVSVDGAPAPPELLWRKHLAVLIYLARAPRRTHTRDHLSGLLWADKPEAAARHSLNEALRVLRRVAGDAAVETRVDQVTLAPETVRLDADHFTELASAGDLEGAAALISGLFLEGFVVPGASAFEDWVAAERQRWTTRCVDVLVRWGESLFSRGHAAEARTSAERALALDPLAEGPMRVLMRALALEGEPTMARERFQHQAEQRLERLGSGPSQALKDLADRILREVPRRVTSEPARLRRSPLVGRERELAKLLSAWSACREQASPAAAVVLGDQGLGKTRLVEELLARARLEGGAVGAVRAVAADRNRMDGGLLAIAEGGLLELPGVAAASPSAMAALAARSPGWAERFPGARAEEAMSLGRAVALVLRTVAEERPLALAVEDVQWLDEASLATIAALPRDLTGRPFLLVVTGPPVPPLPALDELRARLGRDLPGTTLTLAPLNATSLRQLVTWFLPGYAPVDAERLVRRLTMDTAGLPLLAVEVLSAVALGLQLRGEGGAWPQPFRTLDQTLPADLPDVVIGAFRTSFGRLGPAAQQVLAAAAVIEEPVTASRLVRATELAKATVDQALDEAEWSRWLVADGRGYTFVARIMREVIGRDMLTPGQRRRLERRAP